MERIPILLSSAQRLHAGFDDTVRWEGVGWLYARTQREKKNGGTYSSGMVVYTVTKPAIPPMPKVMALGSGWPGRMVPCTNCLSVAYVVNRTAEFAPWRIILEVET